MCQSLFLSCNFIKKETRTQGFSYLKDFTDLDFFYTNISFISFDKYLFATLWAVNRFVGSEISKHNAFDQFWKFKFHFVHFPRKIRFLSFDGPSNYLYLFKNQRQTFRDQENVRHSTSKLLHAFLYKPHFYKQCQAEIGKKSGKCYAKLWSWTFTI